MSHSLLRLSLLTILTAAGCAWQPETIYTPKASSPSADIGIEIDSSRSLSGVEHGTRYVYPNTKDSVQYIIVNGKIVWAASPYPYYEDSISPYHIDGSKNIVTIVWPSVSQTDTESFVDSTLQILSPTPGDTIVRMNGITIKCPALSHKSGRQIELDDGIDTIGFYLDSTGIIAVSDTSLLKMHGSMIRITLNDFTNFAGYTANKFYSTFLDAYRSIQYPMK
jgi:hypothetical protein